MKNCKILILLLLLVSFGRAQFSDSTRYYLNYSSTGNYNRTKINRSFLINNSLEFKHKSDKIVTNFSVKQLLGQQGEKLVNNDFRTLFDFNHYVFSSDFYYWGLLSYSSIYSLKVNHQLQSGAGLAYNIFNGKILKLNISDGLLYDYSDLQQNDTLRDIYQTPRNSLRLQLKLQIKKNFLFQTAWYYQHSLEHRHDYIIKNETDLLIHLIGVLNLNAKLQYSSMSRTGQETLLLTWGLAIHKYF